MLYVISIIIIIICICLYLNFFNYTSFVYADKLKSSKSNVKIKRVQIKSKSSKSIPKLKSNKSAASNISGYITMVNNSTLPNNRLDEIKSYANDMYQKMLNDFPSEISDTSVIINAGGDPNQTVPAYAQGNKITLNNSYFETHLKSIDAVTHELFHVVQSKTTKKAKNIPKWITEGTADWARDKYGIQDKQNILNDQTGWSLNQPPSSKSSYTDGYTTTARFFKYLDTIKPDSINSLIKAVYRTGIYDETLWWKNVYGSDIDNLWYQYILAH